MMNAVVFELVRAWSDCEQRRACRKVRFSGAISIGAGGAAHRERGWLWGGDSRNCGGIVLQWYAEAWHWNRLSAASLLPRRVTGMGNYMRFLRDNGLSIVL